MSSTTAGLLQVLLVIVALVAVHRPLGDYMARVFTSERHLRVERLAYRFTGVDPDADQRWSVYLRSVLAFSFVSILALYVFQRLQASPSLSRLGFPGVKADQAWNTAVSFVTNTNWQSYSGEATHGLPRPDGRPRRAELRLRRRRHRRRRRARPRLRPSPHRPARQLLGRPRPRDHPGPAAARVRRRRSSSSLGGVVQNFVAARDITTLAGGTQGVTGGPVASQEAIKELGTNGGGFFNANSAHPFENPTALDQPRSRSSCSCVDPVQPAPHVRPDGRRPPAGLRDPRGDGDAVPGDLAALTIALRDAPRRAARSRRQARRWRARRSASASSPRRCSRRPTTLTSTGAVNSMH